jgi:beta-xylosidase
MKKRLLMLCALGVCLSASKVSAQEGTQNEQKPTYKKLSGFTPDAQWFDTDGELINAHGGGILYQNKTYYWYGEKRGKSRSEGVSVYSSKDLYNWKNEGIALAQSKDTTSDISEGCLMERPKVIYNRKTKQYVMWVHLELRGKGYAAARAAIATSSTPIGPFTFIKSIRPNGNMSRDMNLFVDDDGSAYHIYSSDENMDLRMAKLTDDYLSPTTQDSVLFRNQREAPAVFKKDGVYYLITSGCTGWAPNQASLHTSKSLFGPWKLVGDPMIGPNANITFYGQSTYVLPVQGKKNAFIYIGDKWNPKDLKDSRYQWLPVQFNGDKLEIGWQDKWDLKWFDRKK